jgi:hypothetical protein
MAELHTTKKSRRRRKKTTPEQVAQIEVLTDVAAAMVKHWARSATKQILAKDPVPVIVPAPWGYRVGRFSIKSQKNQTWKVYDQNQECLEIFNWQQSAMAYCVLEHRRKYHLSKNIVVQDHLVGKLEMDIEHYQRSLRSATAKKDTQRRDFIWARYLYTRAQYDHAKNNLEKTLNSTKYLKVWD